ncbi:MAG: hypothetical protein ACUVTO_02765 [Candidatus Caldatribacteriaceae bacterium]
MEKGLKLELSILVIVALVLVTVFGAWYYKFQSQWLILHAPVVGAVQEAAQSAPSSPPPVRLQICNWRWYIVDNNQALVLGTIENTADVPAHDIKVKVTFLTKDMEYITSATEYIGQSVVKPGQKAAFWFRAQCGPRAYSAVLELVDDSHHVLARSENETPQQPEGTT